MDAARVAKAHFQLLWVRVDVHHGRIQLEVQQIRRESTVEQHVVVRQSRRTGHQPVAHEPAIQERELKIGLRARKRRERQPTVQAQALRLVAKFNHMRGKILAADLRHARQPLGRRTCGRQCPNPFAVVRQRESDIEARQGQTFQHAHGMLELGGFGAQKLAPRRDVEEQIAHFQAGTLRVRGRFGCAQLPVAGLHRPGVLRLGASRNQR